MSERGGYDNRRTNLEDEESDRSGHQGDGRSVWIDGAGCRKSHSGTEGVDARSVRAESFSENRAGVRQPVTSGYVSHHRDAIASATGGSMKHEGSIRSS